MLGALEADPAAPVNHKLPFLSARAQDSHAAQAVIVPSQIKARDSQGLLAYSRGCSSTKITYSHQLHSIQKQLVVPFGGVKQDIFEL